MRLGFGLPQCGPLGVPEAIGTVAKSAEDFGAIVCGWPIVSYGRSSRAREAQGWFLAGIPLNGIGPMFEGIKATAGEARRNPAELELIIRANVEISDAPIQKDRVDFSGTLEQMAEDVTTARRLARQRF
jgi:hypothetical protein